MDAQKVEKITVLAIKDEQGKVVGFLNKNGPVVEFYTSSVAGFDEIESLMKELSTNKK
jgi:hypothetical protein